MKCSDCKHWKDLIKYYQTEEKEGACSKLAHSEKITYLVDNGEDIHQFITDADFFCYHFANKE